MIYFLFHASQIEANFLFKFLFTLFGKILLIYLLTSYFYLIILCKLSLKLEFFYTKYHLKNMKRNCARQRQKERKANKIQNWFLQFTPDIIEYF